MLTTAHNYVRVGIHQTHYCGASLSFDLVHGLGHLIKQL